jgi:hypothetical protein
MCNVFANSLGFYFCTFDVQCGVPSLCIRIRPSRSSYDSRDRTHGKSMRLEKTQDCGATLSTAAKALPAFCGNFGEAPKYNCHELAAAESSAVRPPFWLMHLAAHSIKHARRLKSDITSLDIGSYDVILLHHVVSQRAFDPCIGDAPNSVILSTSDRMFFYIISPLKSLPLRTRSGKGKRKAKGTRIRAKK